MVFRDYLHFNKNLLSISSVQEVIQGILEQADIVNRRDKNLVLKYPTL